MLIEIDIWCSHKLATWIMTNYQNDLWVNAIRDNEDKKLAEHIKPKFKSRNSSVGQHGSLFPKMLYFYECEEKEFLIDEPINTENYRNHASNHLLAYYDFEIGYRPRSTDRDNISPYPYLSVESKDYFTSHTIETDYAGEDFLRLIYRQLKNLNSTHCFMTQIRAYDKNFDVCYQSIDVMNPAALKESPCKDPITLQHSWLGMREIGYSLTDVESNVSNMPDDWNFVTKERLAKLVDDGEIEYPTVSNFELQQRIEWLEHWNDFYLSITYDLVCEYTGWKTEIIAKKEVTILPFDWLDIPTT